jgi:hypothetical protein
MPFSLLLPDEFPHPDLPLTPPDLIAYGRDIPPPPGPFTRLVARIAYLLGLDRAIAFTLLARSWSSIAGIVTLTLIARLLTPAEQGYYYTFYSLVALQIVFELGFSVVILQTASHEAAHLTISADGTIAGPRSSHARLASVLQKSIRWYTVAAILMAAIVLPLGMRFFGAQTYSHPFAQPVAWRLPWILVILATSCTFQIDPTFSFLEGCGFVAQVARTRLTQAVLGTCMGWTALLLHHGLLAPGLMILGQALAGAGFVYKKRDLLVPLLRHRSNVHHIDWGSEIWPFQWRIAVSWVCGYMIFQLFNPILFHYRGPVEAGQMGMSTNICGTLSSMAIAWMSTKASPFGQMIARREYEKLDQIFFRTLAQSVSAATLACGLAWMAIVVLRAHHAGFALRLLPPAPLAMLLGATLLTIVVFAEALYLRAHKQEKFMINAILFALWMAPTSFFFGSRYGAYGVAASYLAGSLLIGLGHGTYTFLKWRHVWHKANPVPAPF